VSVPSLDRDAARRVMRLASESSGVAGVLPDDDRFSTEMLVAAAAEVGIPAEAVHRALAAERLDPTPAVRTGDGLLGSAVVTVDAEFDASAPDVLARLDDWFVEGHHLRRDRVRGGRGEWVKRPGLVGRAARTVRVAVGEGRLGKVRRIAVSTGETGDGTTLVRVEVDRTHERRAAAAAGLAVATVATAGAVAVAVVTAPVLFVAAPLGLAAGLGVAAGGRAQANTIRGEVDRVLEAVDDHAAPTPLRTDVARRVAGRNRKRSSLAS
jgi:hypothetical protein